MPSPIPPDDWCATFVPGLGYIPAIPEPFFAQSWFGARKRYTCTQCHEEFKTRPDYELHYAIVHLSRKILPSPAPTYTPDDIAHLEWVRTQYRDICERLQAAVQKHNLAPPGEPQFLDKLVVAALDRLIAENAQLREDKARRAK